VLQGGAAQQGVAGEGKQGQRRETH
jgi:hypothetical protein